ncbi:uncharacterized protein DUF1992 [Haloactinopolyspora alba]|uniref:Uncharacterized protein DUF1992 n=1 Tax=Haloactinopolyspora alba TaxID=648780 RepID=A0A2P8DPM0_9ACTN|nr:uncharacterized protein DUF1992 [Haloactinopolyspora alba]
MTERKPSGIDFETWIDKQIREAQERGEFDDLPGAGKPLPNLGRQRDELWWVRDKLAREGLSTEEVLPTALKLRKETHRLPETVRDLTSEDEVRAVVADLNARIKAWLRAPSGPHIRVGLVNADTVVAQWKEDRAASASDASTTVPASQEAAAPSRPRWWHRLTSRQHRA